MTRLGDTSNRVEHLVSLNVTSFIIDDAAFWNIRRYKFNPEHEALETWWMSAHEPETGKVTT